MFYELARAFVQRIFQDKILMGLVIVGVLGIFVGIGGGTEKKEHRSIQQQEMQAASQNQEKPKEPRTNASKTLEPAEAVKFLSWWLNGAMDYNPASAARSHGEAMAWMTPDAAASFQATFWPQHVAEGVVSGRVIAAFHPSQVVPVAINPDGSVVVKLVGTMVTQSGKVPAVQQIAASFLVRKENQGMRISGIHASAIVMSASSVY